MPLRFATHHHAAFITRIEAVNIVPKAIKKRLREVGFQVSMSGRGNCYDNAAVETFFKTLKAELIWRHAWVTRQQVSNALFQYIHGFYNTRRKHSAIGGAPPVKFERPSA
jgi:putative transposase